VGPLVSGLLFRHRHPVVQGKVWVCLPNVMIRGTLFRHQGRPKVWFIIVTIVFLVPIHDDDDADDDAVDDDVDNADDDDAVVVEFCFIGIYDDGCHL
jgi:hypothetical protein